MPKNKRKRLKKPFHKRRKKPKKFWRAQVIEPFHDYIKINAKINVIIRLFLYKAEEAKGELGKANETIEHTKNSVNQTVNEASSLAGQTKAAAGNVFEQTKQAANEALAQGSKLAEQEVDQQLSQAEKAIDASLKAARSVADQKIKEANAYAESTRDDLEKVITILTYWFQFNQIKHQNRNRYTKEFL